MADFDPNRKPRFRKRDSGRFGRRDDRPRRESGRFGRRDDRPGNYRRDTERREMHKIICDKCGESCEVPFRPTPGKPIYCDNCFRANKGSRNNSSKEFDQINEKLDRILKALDAD